VPRAGDKAVRLRALARTRTVRDRKAGMAKDEDWQGGPIGDDQRRQDEIKRRADAEAAEAQRKADEEAGKAARRRKSN